MHPIRTAGTALALLPGLLGVRPAAAQTGYAFTSYDAPGSIFTSIAGVNDSGQFAGVYEDQTGTAYGFYDHGPSVLTIYDPSTPPGTPGGFLEINGINNAGTYVGDYGAGTAHGFIGSGFGPVVTSDEPANAGLSFVGGINNHGDTVGTYLGSDGNEHSYLNSGGAFTSFDVPGYATSEAGDINDSDVIVGAAAPGPGTGPTVGYVKQGGAFSFIDIPGAADVYASGINNAGDVVGFFDTTLNGPATGFVDANGVITDISFPSGNPSFPTQQTLVNGINNSGEIVGEYVDAFGTAHGFYATVAAVPEAPPVGLLVVGGVVLAFAVRKRRGVGA